MRVKIAEYAIIYTLGAIGYSALEIVWRGYTHWTMTITGGICFAAIYFINDHMHELSLLKKCAICTLIITAIEFAVGCVVNIMLGWRVWDYSGLPFSLMGQICLGFCALWFLLCIPVVWFSDFIRNWVFG